MSFELLSQVWPEWTVVKQIGSGAFGTVYQAVRTDHNVESYAAIKIITIPQDPSEIDSLRSEGIGQDGTRAYFQGIVNDFVGEIRLMETLKGLPNIVSVEDYKVIEKTEEIGWDILIRMELLTPFHAYAAGKKLSETDVIKLGIDICSALEICGRCNVIHRDIKPENIFINDFGFFKLGDFGIARKLENMTGNLSQKGSPNYMAPEVANSPIYDERADLYSLGIVLYMLLNENRLPFLNSEKQALNPVDRKLALERRLRGEPLPAPCAASPAMRDLILKACAYDPNRRFLSAAEMKAALEAVRNGSYTVISDDSNATIAVRRTESEFDGTTVVRRKTDTLEVHKETVEKRKMPTGRIAAICAGVVAVAVLAALAVTHIQRDNEAPGSTDVIQKESLIQTEIAASEPEDLHVPAAQEKAEQALLAQETGVELVGVKKLSTQESGILYHSCRTNADGFVVNSAGLVISDCVDYRLTEGDIADLSIEELKIARNEFYARKGMSYGDVTLNEYFAQYPWYQTVDKIPLDTWINANLDATMLSAAERDNINTLMKCLTRRIEESELYRKYLCGGYWHDYEGNVCMRYLFDSDGTVAILKKDVRDGSILTLEKGRFPGYTVFDETYTYVIAGYERVWHIDPLASSENRRIYWDEDRQGETVRHYLVYHDGDLDLNALQNEAASIVYTVKDGISVMQIQIDPSVITSETRADRSLYPRPERTLQRGSQGEDVKYVQAMLVVMNYDGVVVDGDFGPVTEDALLRWQKNHGYARNGIVDFETLLLLEESETAWLARQ